MRIQIRRILIIYRRFLNKKSLYGGPDHRFRG